MKFDSINEKDAPAPIYIGVWPTRDELYDMYWNNKMSQKQISDELGYALGTIYSMMDEYNIPRRSWGDSHRIYSVNKDFFKPPWNHEMAYVLGEGICADGNIHNRLTRFGVYSNDKELLEDIRNVMQSEHPIKPKKGTRGYIFIVNSVEMVQDLLNLGITPNKSLTLKFPPVPEEFMPSFLRGHFDGDGYVSPVKGQNSLDVGITCASDIFNLDLQAILCDVGIKSSLQRRDGELSGVYIWKCSTKKFYDFIYSTPGPYLKRKKDKFDKFFKGNN